MKPFVISWEQRSSTVPLASYTWMRNAAAYHLGYFWCVSKGDSASKGRIIRSADGITWDIITDNAPFDGYRADDLQMVGYPYSSLAVIGVQDTSGYPNKIWTSYDGVTWNESDPNFPSRRHCCFAAYSDSSIIVMAGQSPGGSLLNDVWIGTGLPGSTWTRQVANASWNPRCFAGSICANLLYSYDVWIAGGSSGSSYRDVWRSADQGVTWTKVVDNLLWQPSQLIGIYDDWNGHQLYGFDSQSPIYHTTDGVTWNNVGNVPNSGGSNCGLASIPPGLASADDVYLMGGEGYVCYLGSQDVLSSSSSPSSSSSSSRSSSSFSSSSSSLSSSSSSSSQSEWDEKIKDFISLDINPHTGNPLFVARGTSGKGGGGENAHIALFQVNSSNDGLIDYKVLPKPITSGDAFVLQRENSVIPFAWDAVESRNKSLELPFKFGQTDDILVKAEDYIFSEPKEQEVIIPSDISGVSTHSRLVNVGVWSDDTSGISGIKIGSVVGMPFDDFRKPESTPDDTSKIPVFSWEPNPSIVQQSFAVGKSNGSVETYMFANDVTKLSRIASTQTNKSPVQAAPINNIIKDNRGFYWASNQYGIIKIDAFDLMVNDFIHDVNHPIVACVDNEQNLYAIAEAGNQLVKISPDKEKTYVKGFSGLTKAIWSDYHDAVFAMSDRSVYKCKDLQVELVNQSEKYRFYDMDVGDNGVMAVIINDDMNSIIKVLHNDLTLMHNINLRGYKASKCSFAQGYLFVFTEDLGIDVSGEDDEKLASVSTLVDDMIARVGDDPDALLRASETFLELLVQNEPLWLVRAFISMIQSRGKIKLPIDKIPPESIRYVMMVIDVATGKINRIYHESPARYEFLVYDDNNDTFCLFDQNGAYLLISYWTGRYSELTTGSGIGKNTCCVKSGSSVVQTQKYWQYIVDNQDDYSHRDVERAKKMLDKIIATKKPSAIRVFVGSKYGLNDMWDSGEVETVKTSIMYGGGDNLKPGYRYFAHIAIRYGDGYYNKISNRMADELPESVYVTRVIDGQRTRVLIENPTQDEYRAAGWSPISVVWGDLQVKEFTVPK